jgi:hypothetical protein
MSDEALTALIEAYLRAPDDANRRAVREVLASRGNYDPELSVERVAAPYLSKKSYADLIQHLLDLMPGAMLSPSAHQLLAEAYTQLGDGRAAQHQETLADLSMKAVLASGEGTASSPWAVLRVSDEHDVVAHFGHTSEHLRYEERDGRLLDVHLADDGRKVWFDVSLLQEPSLTA